MIRHVLFAGLVSLGAVLTGCETKEGEDCSALCTDIYDDCNLDCAEDEECTLTCEDDRDVCLGSCDEDVD